MSFGQVDEELRIALTLDSQGYLRSTKLVAAGNKDIADSIDKIEKSAKRAQQLGYELGQGLRYGFNVASSAATALLAVDTALIAAGVTASKKAAEFESLTLALAAVDGGASAAEESLKRLRDIARGPGLGVSEAVGAYAGLVRNGLDRELAMSLTRELGNAVARSGGGKELLGRAGLALGQMATRPFAQGQELNQLTEAGIPAYKMLSDQFGTADTEELKRRGVSSAAVLSAFNEQMSKTERVAGGAKNAFENLEDSWDQLQVQLGTGINEVLVPGVNSLAKEIDKLADTGELKAFGKTFAETWTGIFDTFTGGTGEAESAVESLMISALAASYATRNVQENVASIWDILKGAILPAGMGGVVSGIGSSILGASPFEEAKMALERSKEQARLDRELERRRKGKSLADDPPKKDPVPDTPSTFPILREIADNTRPLLDIRDMILGGGAATRAAFNARNISGWSSGGGSGRGMRKVIEGMEEMMAEQVASLGHGGFLGNASARG